eukprot:jgi/Picsp_1/4241/NSC_01750-R1_lariat debranching enzyme
MAALEHDGLRIAVEGCCHGELDKIYEAVGELERMDGKKIDLLICCGDFQAVRNLNDLECMACPVKYRHMASFYKYFSGDKVAPYPTLFIGGNHEAINYLWELYYGGWVAPNIYFLGYSGVVWFGGIRIAGLSGIYKKHDYLLGHCEAPPYSEKSLRSAYHIRALEVSKLMALKRPIDVFLSHDWPAGITAYGDEQGLIRRKRFLASDIQHNMLGSPPAMSLLRFLKPRYWFSAHLHTKFAALVPHGSEGEYTRFLSLDKCLPGRDFLQVIDFPGAVGEKKFTYDAEWLAITKQSHPLLRFEARNSNPPPPISLSEEEVSLMKNMLEKTKGHYIPENFEPTQEPYNPTSRQTRGVMPRHLPANPQTSQFLNMLGLDNPFLFQSSRGKANEDNNYRYRRSHNNGTHESVVMQAENPEDIQLDDDDDSNDLDDGDNQAGVSNSAVDPSIQAILPK